MLFQSNPSPTTKLKLDKTGLDLDLFLSDSVNKTIRKSRHLFYFKANKPSKLLARALKKINRPSKPIQLKLSQGTYTSNPMKNLNAFQKHLASLYNREDPLDQTSADSSFLQFTLPTIPPVHCECLENPISTSELLMAIKSLKLNKHPGPDGLSALYYKKFASILAPVLTEALNSLLNRHTFRTEILTAIISMIPKPHSDETSCSNYRPISVLNLEIKLLAKVLATRLNNIVGSLIHRDQVGFIPKRQAGDNIRRAALLPNLGKSHFVFHL